ncbi:hypothetical protein [Arcticibacter tournemirensis]|uniref:hypothetical protein n=1 Tax=Arcticibacter tournemirensis TaxID=699437 RepID=UPI0014769C8B|nr:hypothetical protein [Arcticibacter tournemirensis]
MRRPHVWLRRWGFPQELDQDIVKQINELQSLQLEDRQHILRTLGALIKEAKTRLTFG